jgi:predicted nucleic acid-binding protein
VRGAAPANQILRRRFDDLDVDRRRAGPGNPLCRHAPATQAKRIAATRLLALPRQVGCEFVAASRKLAAAGFTEAQACAALAAMRGLADVILLPVPDLWTEAEAIQGGLSLSFWDALLVAACLRGGVRVLYTEEYGRTKVHERPFPS